MSHLHVRTIRMEHRMWQDDVGMYMVERDNCSSMDYQYYLPHNRLKADVIKQKMPEGATCCG